MDEFIDVPTADKSTCERYYKNHKNSFIDKKTNKILPFDLVRDHIEDYLEVKAHQAALSTYIDRLVNTANIVGL